MHQDVRKKSKNHSKVNNVNDSHLLYVNLRFCLELPNHVEKNFTYVGKDFPEEARKIFYGEAESKNIYGQATQSEIKSLNDEGVSTVAIPFKPIEKDKLN